MGHLTGELKTFARKSSGEPQLIGLRKLVDDVLFLLNHRLTRGRVAVRIDIDGGDIDLWCDAVPRLGERRDQLAGSMSGGEQQMLAMGRALMAKPKVLLLDEPSMGLSPIMVDKIFEVVNDIHKQGVTMLLVEQNASRALAVADRGYVMESGLITMTGAGRQLLEDPKVRAAYLGE